MDILKDARQSIVTSRVKMIETPPKDFSKPYNISTGIVGGGTLGTVGLLLGSHTGIALFGTAISGAWILAPILGIIGLAAGTISKEKDNAGSAVIPDPGFRNSSQRPRGTRSA